MTGDDCLVHACSTNPPGANGTVGRAFLAVFIGVSGLIAFQESAVAQTNHNKHNLLLTATSHRALNQLQQPCRLWTQQSLRTTVNELSKNYGIAIWIDRRIDPTQLVNLPQTSESATLIAELSRLAVSCNADSGLVENVFLIAPKGEVARIQKAAVVLHGQLSSCGKPIAQISRPLQWPDICTSNELLDLIRKGWQLEVHGTLPHDLFHAGSLPESSLATQLALLLGGFDLQAVISNTTVSTGPKVPNEPDQPPATPKVPNQATVTASDEPTNELLPAAEPLPTGESNRTELRLRPLSESRNWQDNYSRNVNAELLAELSQRYPGSSLKQESSRRIAVNGETNLHIEILATGLATGRVRSGDSALQQQLYSFSIEAKLPLEAVLQNLSKNFQLELEWSEHCTQADRNRLIELRVENVSRQQLFKEVCEQAEMDVEFRDQSIIILPKNQRP